MSPCTCKLLSCQASQQGANVVNAFSPSFRSARICEAPPGSSNRQNSLWTSQNVSSYTWLIQHSGMNSCKIGSISVSFRDGDAIHVILIQYFVLCRWGGGLLCYVRAVWVISQGWSILIASSSFVHWLGSYKKKGEKIKQEQTCILNLVSEIPSVNCICPQFRPFPC